METKGSHKVWMTRQSLGVLFVSSVLGVLGFMMMASGVLNSPDLPGRPPGSPSSDIGSGLGFFLSGWGLLTLHLSWFRVASILGGGIGFVGALGFLGPNLGVDIPIDWLRDRSIASMEPIAHGSMSPVLSFSFVIIGTALLGFGSPIGRHVQGSIRGWIGAFLICMILGCLWSSRFGVGTDYVWMVLIELDRYQMGGLFLLGLGLISHGLGIDQWAKRKIQSWAPVLAFVGLEIIVFILWQALTVKEVEYIQKATEPVANDFKQELASKIEIQIQALMRMAKRWEVSGPPTRTTWGSDAQHYLLHFSGLESVAWIDPSLHSQWNHSRIGGQGEPSSLVREDLLHRMALDRVDQDQGGVMVSRSLPLADGRPSFRVYVPLTSEGVFEGFILGVLDLQKILEEVAQQSRYLSYSVALFDGMERIYGHSMDPKYLEVWELKTEVEFSGTSWGLLFWPRAERLTHLGSPIPELTLGIGTILVLLLTWMVYQGQSSEHQQREAQVLRVVQRETERANRRMKQILDTSREGIYGLDMKGNTTFFSPSAASMTGWDPQELIGKPEHTVLHHTKANGKPYPWKDCPICASIRHGVIRHVDDEVFWKKDGTSFPVDYTSTPIRNERGVLVGAVVAFRDIADFRRWEEEISAQNRDLNRRVTDQTEKLDDVDQDNRLLLGRLEQAQTHLIHLERMASMGQLMSGTVHEINNAIGYLNSNMSALIRGAEEISRLVSGMNGIFEIQAQENKAMLPAEIERVRALSEELNAGNLSQEMVQIIRESSEGLEKVGQIVQTLREYSRFEEPTEAWSNVNRGLDDTLRLVWNDVKYKAEVIKEYGTIPEVLCYPQELTQVYLNLLMNAAESISTKGKIWIRTFLEEDRLVVEVQDTGRGILPEHVGKVFNPFFSTKSNHKSTGLGLSVCQEIIRRHGGEIKVQSILGKGTKVIVSLPVTERAPAEGVSS